MRTLILYFSLLCLTTLTISVVIPTQQRTSLQPYVFNGGISDPQHHYSFYQGDLNSLYDYVKSGYWHITDTEIIYLVKRSRLDLNRYKLIKYDILTNTFGKAYRMLYFISNRRILI